METPLFVILNTHARVFAVDIFIAVSCHSDPSKTIQVCVYIVQLYIIWTSQFLESYSTSIIHRCGRH